MTSIKILLTHVIFWYNIISEKIDKIILYVCINRDEMSEKSASIKSQTLFFSVFFYFRRDITRNNTLRWCKSIKFMKKYETRETIYYYKKFVYSSIFCLFSNINKTILVSINIILMWMNLCGILCAEWKHYSIVKKFRFFSSTTSVLLSEYLWKWRSG